MTIHYSRHRRLKRARKSQHGGVLILIVVALLPILAMVGLAVDASRAGYVKARLQSAVDAAALSAAKVLDQTGNTAAAASAATGSLNSNAELFREFKEALESGLVPTVQFSSTAAPFQSGSSPSRYVRVSVQNLDFPVSLSAVIGMSTLKVRASAIAGPSAAVSYACNIFPVAACADLAVGKPHFGYVPGKVYGMRTTGGTTPGNFSFLSIEGNGASVLREKLAGGYAECTAIGEQVLTKPGQSSGPVREGINTRFGEYKGGGVNDARYPPDVVTDEPNPALSVDSKTGAIKQGSRTINQASDLAVNHAIYQSDITAGRFDFQPRPSGTGAFLRRELAVPLVDCADVPKGRTLLPVVGFGCFFLLQRVASGGSGSQFFAEYLQDCEAGGRPGSNPPGANGGPYTILMFRDYDSPDS